MHCHIGIALLCIAAASTSALTNQEVTRHCERKAEDAFGSSRDKCTAFKRCCAENCRKEGRSVVSDTCEGRFFDTAEKDCICGRPQSGGRSSRRRSEGDLTEMCTREGDEEMGSVNSKCQKFKRCCRSRCSDRGMEVHDEICDGYMYSLAEKRCRCRAGRGGSRRGGSDRGGDRPSSRRGGSSRGRGGSSSRRGSTDSQVQEDCEREGDNIDGSVSSKCSAFKRCCSRECRENGGRDRINKCDGFIYLTAQKTCQCTGGDDGLRHRPDSSRTRGRSDNSAKCREKARLSPYDSTVKCRAFKTCCIDACLRAGGVTDDNTCVPGDLDDADCTCDVNSGRGGSDRRGSGHGDRRGSGHGDRRGGDRGDRRGSGSWGGGKINETHTCNRAFNDAFGSKSTKCKAFKRCCKDECQNHGMSIAREHCDTTGRGRSGYRDCTCGGSGSGSTSSPRGSFEELSRQCRRQVERTSSSRRDKCDRFKSCCRRECVDLDMAYKHSRCDRYGFDRASCECQLLA